MPYQLASYTGRDSKIGRCQGDALNLSQAKPALKADKLKKFIDAGGHRMQWLFDVGRTNFRITSGIHREGFKNWEMPRRRSEFEPGEAGA
jgi:hypothetical protein